MFVALAYRLLVTVLTWLTLLARSSSSKDVEILAVRHEALFVPDGGGRPSSPCRRSGGVKLEAA